MATTKTFSTGGGFPHDNSPGRTIEFTLSCGKSELLDPNSAQPSYGYRIEFSDPEDRAYVCAMYGPPRDEEGLNAFARQLGYAYRTVSNDPSYGTLPVPPLPYKTQFGADRQAAFQIEKGGIAQGCLWAQQFGPGTNLAIDIANSPGANAFRAQAIAGDNRVVAQQSGSADNVPNAPVLSKRVITRDDGNNGVGNPPSSTDGFEPMVPTRAALPQAESNPAPRLVRVSGNTSPAMPVFENQSSWSRFGSGIASPQGILPRDPNLPVPPPEAEGPLGLVSGKPMRFFQAPIFDTRNSSDTGDNWFTAALLRGNRASQPSSFDANPPQIPFATDRQNSLMGGNTATPVASGPGDAFASPISLPQDSEGALSLNDAYLEYLKRLNGKQAQASTFDASAPAAPLAPSDDANFSGGMLGRLTALMAVDPQNPERLAPPLQDNELSTFYGDNSSQPWTLQRRR